MCNIKIQSLCQGSRLAIVYALEFKLLVCNISWVVVTFKNQLQFGLQGDMKDLLLTLSDLSTLSQHC
jgi:hypothetical protein